MSDIKPNTRPLADQSLLYMETIAVGKIFFGVVDRQINFLFYLKRFHNSVFLKKLGYFWSKLSFKKHKWIVFGDPQQLEFLHKAFYSEYQRAAVGIDQVMVNVRHRI